MSDDKFDQLLAEIKSVQEMQAYHTQRFDKIDELLGYVVREIRGPIVRDLKEIQKRLGLATIDPVKEQEKVKV